MDRFGQTALTRRRAALGFALLCGSSLAARAAEDAPERSGTSADPGLAPPNPKPRRQMHETGIASWYDPRQPGRRTASGETFDPDKFTAAHPYLAMNTMVRVVNLANGRAVTLRVNDRSARNIHRVIDVTPRAAEALGMRERGLARVLVEVLPALGDSEP